MSTYTYGSPNETELAPFFIGVSHFAQIAVYSTSISGAGKTASMDPPPEGEYLRE